MTPSGELRIAPRSGRPHWLVSPSLEPATTLAPLPLTLVTVLRPGKVPSSPPVVSYSSTAPKAPATSSESPRCATEFTTEEVGTVSSRRRVAPSQSVASRAVEPATNWSPSGEAAMPSTVPEMLSGASAAPERSNTSIRSRRPPARTKRSFDASPVTAVSAPMVRSGNRLGVSGSDRSTRRTVPSRVPTIATSPCQEAL